MRLTDATLGAKLVVEDILLFIFVARALLMENDSAHFATLL